MDFCEQAIHILRTVRSPQIVFSQFEKAKTIENKSSASKPIGCNKDHKEI